MQSTHFYVKIGTVNHILNKLNDFQKSRRFTCKFKKTKLSFLDLLLVRDNDISRMIVCRKPTNSHIYLN